MKYVIDTDDYKGFNPKYCMVFGDGGYGIDMLDIFTELTPEYVKEHFRDLQEAVYQKGYDEAKLIYQNPHAESDYQRGIEYLWDALKELYLSGECRERFGVSFGELMKNSTESEAIAKMRAHKQRKKEEDEIKVGDEVFNGEDRYIVTYIYGKECDGIDNTTGIVCERMKLQELKKTGRTFPQLKEFLKEMRK